MAVKLQRDLSDAEVRHLLEMSLAPESFPGVVFRDEDGIECQLAMKKCPKCGKAMHAGKCKGM